METTAQCRWRVPEQGNLVWRHWDGEYVFHHALSNDTHRLSEIAGQLVVHLMAAGEHSTQDLATHFDWDEPGIDDILNELATLDFVTCRS